jgi:hypothetical protein
MYVIKRNGDKEILSYDKISQRIKQLNYETSVQSSGLVMKIMDQLHDNLLTSKIDELISEQCASMGIHHYDYSILAAANLNLRFSKTNDIISSDLVSIDPALGFEFGYTDFVFIRAGAGNFQNVQQLDGSERVGFQPNIGLGFKYKGIHVDYALTNLANQNASLYSNVFSIKVDLGQFRN